MSSSGCGGGARHLPTPTPPDARLNSRPWDRSNLYADGGGGGCDARAPPAPRTLTSWHHFSRLRRFQRSVDARGRLGGSARALPPATTPPNQQLFPFIRVQRAAGGGVSAERGGGRARPSPSPLLGSIADKFLFSSHCMSELGGDKEPRGEGRAPPTPFHSVHPPPSTATAYG